MRSVTVFSCGTRYASVLSLLTLAGLAGPGEAVARSGSGAPPAVRGEIVVRYAQGAARAAINHHARVHAPRPGGPRTRVVTVRPGHTVASALRVLRGRTDVLYAAPNAIAKASAFIPDDPGPAGTPMGWQQSQWNFLAPAGVNAPVAWEQLNAVGRPGGKGTIVAVVDSGVAYRSVGRYRQSPDFDREQFVRGYDFLGRDDRPYDTSGHGTHVASTIAERTNNGVALTGLAYGAKIMPIRVLDRRGYGDVSDIARGVRFAVLRGADVINLSFEFDPRVRARHVPSLVEALRFAERRGVLVVAAAGNEGVSGVPYPAAYKTVIAVGATTVHRCAAEYSNYGRRIDLVAPGGGPDKRVRDPGCDPDGPSGPEILQLTFDRHPRDFGYPGGFEGTSMAAPHVSATAALVIASGVLGPRPKPRAILARLQTTAQDLGRAGEDVHYGAGLIDAARATAPAVKPAPPVAPAPALVAR